MVNLKNTTYAVLTIVNSKLILKFHIEQKDMGRQHYGLG